MAHNEAHNALVREALEKLAIEGYCGWRNETGAWMDDKGVPHKFGKKGSADIFIILPRQTINIHTGNREIVGQHVEAEAKTGAGRQSENQKKHQEFVVEKNGGAYILFRTVDDLLCRLKAIK